MRFGDRWLIAITVLSGAAVLAQKLSCNGVAGGENWADFHPGLIRVAYPFSAGILLSRLSSRFRGPASVSATKAAACVALLLAILVVQVPERSNGIYEAIAVLVLLPALMLFAASVTPAPWSRSFACWLGAISYPLYATHYFVVRTITGTLRRLDGVTARHHGIVIAGAMAACLLMAWVCLKKIDEPARRWLTGRLSMAGRDRGVSVG